MICYTTFWYDNGVVDIFQKSTYYLEMYIEILTTDIISGICCKIIWGGGARKLGELIIFEAG